MESKHIFFCSHNPENYSANTWRSVFSQWLTSSFVIQDFLPYSIPITEKHKHLLQKHTFTSCEQWMMAHKALLFECPANMQLLQEIFASKSPKDIKTMGRRVENFDADTWNTYAYQIVVNGNYLKFSCNEYLQKILLNTGNDILVEAASYDRIWGIGFNEKDAPHNLDKWGENKLGKALMETRDILRNGMC